MAEYILKNMLKESEITDIKVSSAGLNANGEDKINPKAQAALKKLGITVRRFKPKKIDSDLCRKQDAVICMTENQKKCFIGFKNVYCINELTALGEIADPYGSEQSVYDECASKLVSCCKKIFELLKK